MEIFDILKKNRALAFIASGAIIAGIAISFLLIPTIIDVFSTELSGGSNDVDHNNSKLGARVAKYMDSRESDIVFGWCFNNTVVNDDLSSIFDHFIDAILISGAPLNETVMNVSVVYHPEAIVADINPYELAGIANGFENALVGLDEISTDITIWDNIWPPTFLWDIAYIDGSSLSLIYSREYHVIAAINGTWTRSGDMYLGVMFPNFSYSTHSYETAYFVLGTASEALIESVIIDFQNMITGAFEYNV